MSQRQLIAIGGGGCPLRKRLEGAFASAEELPEATGQSGIDGSAVLYLDGTGSIETVTTDARVQAALERRTPLVIDRPTPELLLALGAAGLEARAAVLTPWSSGLRHVVSFHDGGTEERGLAAQAVPDDERVQGEEHEPPPPEEPPQRSAAPGWSDEELGQAVLDALDQQDGVGEHLERLAADPRLASEIPDHRRWASSHDFHWTPITLTDPSNEQPAKRQTARFRITVNLFLLAADEPLKRKILDFAVGGAGFEPVASSGSLIRDDGKHRGWAQALTEVHCEPMSDADFGHVEDYLPANTSSQVSVVSGYSWDAGMSGDKLSFSYTANQSHTKQTTDFRTLTGSVGSEGMVFWHNARVVGGDTTIDARRLFAGGWNGDKDKMFFYRFPTGTHVRSWPGLAKQLLKPDCEAVWHTPAGQTATGTMLVWAEQGVAYAYVKGATMYIPWVRHQRPVDLRIPFDRATYDPV